MAITTTERCNIVDDDHQDDWNRTWTEFNRAIRSPDDFNAFLWVCRLFVAGIYHIYYKSGLHNLGLSRYWRPIIPFFAISLIISIIGSYFITLRSLIKQRWCCVVTDDNIISCQDVCSWSYLHDSIVIYIGCMILFNYISATLRSPGVALSEEFSMMDEDLILHVQKHQGWKASDGQGGCCCFNATLDVHTEQRRLDEYNEGIRRLKVSLSSYNNNNGHNNNNDDNASFFPSIDNTVCNKCNISRPPRCHHCKICQRCILQFDHHCIWLNNCVGYNNYRTFILTLFYLCLGCLYGVIMLFSSFYENLLERVTINNGFQISYKNNNETGFFDIPPPWILIKQVFTTGIESDVMIQMVFPFLLFVGIVLIIFFGYHIRYIVNARTTLEHKILLETEREEILNHHEDGTNNRQRQNPFDQGWYLNFLQVLGPNIFLAFLPIPINPTPTALCKKKN